MMWYLSHSIRGPEGNAATNTDMEKNCDRAILVGNFIRKAFPSVELYIPGEHEAFVQIAYKKGYLTEKQILDVDCAIIDKCEGVLIFAPADDSEIQGGRLIEYNYAEKTNKPVYVFCSAWDTVHYLSDYLIRN